MLGYHLVGDDLVVFGGGDADDATVWLQYTSLRKHPGGTAAGGLGGALPSLIKEHPDITFSAITNAAGAWIVFTVSADEPGQQGLYVHGPVPLGS